MLHKNYYNNFYLFNLNPGSLVHQFSQFMIGILSIIQLLVSRKLL